jgi:hypothetical protein
LFLEEATMHSPLFIETSKGHINLALVTHIYEHGGELVFQFERSMIAVPGAEGKKLLAELRGVMQTRYADWLMGLK